MADTATDEKPTAATKSARPAGTTTVQGTSRKAAGTKPGGAKKSAGTTKQAAKAPATKKPATKKAPAGKKPTAAKVSGSKKTTATAARTATKTATQAAPVADSPEEGEEEASAAEQITNPMVEADEAPLSVVQDAKPAVKGGGTESEETGFVFSDSDDDDAPAQQVVTAGATADPVKDYLKQIGKVALLNAVQEVELAKRIEAGLFAEEKLANPPFGPDWDRTKASAEDRRMYRDLNWIAQDGKRAKNHLLEANLRLVVSLAKRYTGRGMLFLDLIQEGNLGLIRAVEKFDYTKGYKFSTYATWWIRQAITRAMADQARTIRIPVHMVEVINKLARVQRQMLQDLGREPTPEELAQELDMTPERVVEVQKYGREPISLHTPLGEDGDSEFGDLIEDAEAVVP